VLEVINLSVFHGTIQALWGVSFELEEREIITLVGPNGAGKTTALKAILGINAVRSGSILFLKKPIQNLSSYSIVEAGISLVPEDRRLFPYMSVLENLELGAFHFEARRKKRETLVWIYDLFPILKERRKQLARTLSGGEQQMVAIGRALMSKPKLLMLDEPSLGLAPLIVKELFRVIHAINGMEVTVLLIEQNVQHALDIANRAYVLETGRITLSGQGRDLLNNPHIKTSYLGM